MKTKALRRKREIDTSCHGLLSYVHTNYKTTKGTIPHGMYWENTTYELDTSIMFQPIKIELQYVRASMGFQCQAGKDVIRGFHCPISSLTVVLLQLCCYREPSLRAVQ